MKKRKTYEISVIDKTYSKIISDEAKFYTSDTALELAFELKETEYDFESAEIVLLNIDDRSLTTRPVSKVSNDFVYEIDDDITTHYGEWRGQLMLVEKGEVHVSSPIKFRVENDLYSNKPLEITEVVSWVSLKKYANVLADELKQAVDEAVAKVETMDETFKANELDRDAAEKERQSRFEVAESERDTTFNANEDIRQTQELERETAEATRQTTFDDNEASRDETFNVNEATRQENEDARIEAEKQREGTVAKIENRQTSVETQFDAVQQELTGKDVISAPEIIVARGGEPTLSDRLDKEYQNVTEQLAKTENEVIDVKNSNSKQVTSINNLLSANISTFNEPLVTVTNALNDTKKHVAFPTMAIDGDNILVMYRRGTNHIDTPDGVLVQKKSTDGGVTWGAEQTVYTPPSTFDARDPNVMQLSATKLLLICPIVENNGQIRSVENEVWVSNDFGTTWNKLGKLPKHPTASWYQIVRGSMTKTSTGRILVPVWVAGLKTAVPEGAFIVYSDDDGVTWSVGSWITQKRVTETSIEYDNFGRLYAVMRNDPTLGTYRENNMFINYSDDNGLTWSELQELPLQGHAPHLLKLKDTILLTWRNTNKRHVNATGDRYSVNFCTLKNGAVNSQIYEMLNTGTPDCGYPWAVKNGSKVFVAFYVVAPSVADLIYVKPFDLNRLENLEVIQNDPITYINVANAKTEILKHKTIMGDNSIRGNGTNLSSKSISFGETVKSVRNVRVTILNDTAVNFIATVSGVTTTEFTVNLKNIAGTFSGAVQIYWEAVVEYN